MDMNALNTLKWGEGSGFGEAKTGKKERMYSLHSLFFSPVLLLSPSSTAFELRVISGKLGEMIWSQGAPVGGKSEIHRFLARNRTD